MGVGERLKTLRTNLRLKQGDFAKRLNFSQGAFSDFEKEKKPLADKYIQLICLEFGVHEDWLRTGNGDMFIKTPGQPPVSPDSPDSPEEIPEVRDLLEVFQGLIAINRKLVIDHAHYLLESQYGRQITQNKPKRD